MTRPTFDDYVTARSGALLRFAYLVCGDHHLAEDLVQEVLVKAHRKWTSIEAENPDAYLKQAIIRTHISWTRRRSATEVVTGTLRDEARGGGFADDHATRDELWAMLATLPRAQRAVLVLRYFEDLDDQRIAELVGTSASTVRTHAHRGLNSLRETLAQRAQDAPTGTGLLDRVHKGAARAAARRRIAIAGGIAAVVALLAFLPGILRQPDTAPPIDPSPTVSTSPAPDPTTDPTPGLVIGPPAAVSRPEFPYTFGYVPDGLLPPTFAVEDRGCPGSEGAACATAAFGVSGGEAHEGLHLTASASGPLSVGNFGEGTQTQTVTINGVQASMYVGPDNSGAEVTWQLDGGWLLAWTDGAVSPEELLQFANAIEAGGTRGSAPIDAIESLALPVGFSITGWYASGVCAANGERTIELCVSLLTDVPAREPSRTYRDLTVDGDPAFVAVNAGGEVYSPLIVQRSDGRVVQVAISGEGLALSSSVGAGVRLIDEDFLAIYRGITFTS